MSGRQEKVREALRSASEFFDGEGMQVMASDCHRALAEVEEWEAEADRLKAALPALRELFVDLQYDWRGQRGPCREGIALIDAALAPADPNTT